MVEQKTENLRVGGSIPPPGTTTPTCRVFPIFLANSHSINKIPCASTALFALIKLLVMDLLFAESHLFKHINHFFDHVAVAADKHP